MDHATRDVFSDHRRKRAIDDGTINERTELLNACFVFPFLRGRNISDINGRSAEFNASRILRHGRPQTLDKSARRCTVPSSRPPPPSHKGAFDSGGSFGERPKKKPRHLSACRQQAPRNSVTLLISPPFFTKGPFGRSYRRLYPFPASPSRGWHTSRDWAFDRGCRAIRPCDR